MGLEKPDHNKAYDSREYKRNYTSHRVPAHIFQSRGNNGEYLVFSYERYVYGVFHYRQIDRVKSAHGDDSGEYGMYAAFCLQYARHYSGKGPGGYRKDYSQYVMSSYGAHCRCGQSEGKASLRCKVGNVEYPEGYIYANGKYSVQQSKLQ